MDWFAKLEKKGTGMWFAVCSLDNKTFYGAGGLNDLSKEHKKAEIGFWLLTDFWGKGIMTQVVERFSEYCLGERGLHRLEATVFPHNEASAKVLEKAGFEREGVLKKAYLKNGQFLDGILFAKTS